jgi:hypothetical protein
MFIWHGGVGSCDLLCRSDKEGRPGVCRHRNEQSLIKGISRLPFVLPPSIHHFPYPIHSIWKAYKSLSPADSWASLPRCCVCLESAKSRDASAISNLYMGLFYLHTALASFVSLLQTMTEFFGYYSELFRPDGKHSVTSGIRCEIWFHVWHGFDISYLT